jgi:hypothetical protein
MDARTQANAASATMTNFEVVMGTTSNCLSLLAITATTGLSGNEDDGTSYGKRTQCMFGSQFWNKNTKKKNGLFNLAVEDKKNFKEAADLNKKAMCQFIQAFPTMCLLGMVNLQKKADKLFLSGRAWKLWMELQADFNPDNSITETKLELALSKLKLVNKKNPQKLMEEITSCEVKYGVPVSNGKKTAQLIHLGGKE